MGSFLGKKNEEVCSGDDQENSNKKVKKRLLLLGPENSGKSTLYHQILLASGDKSFQNAMWHDRVWLLMLGFFELLRDTFEEYEGELLIDDRNSIEQLVKKFSGAQIKDSADFNDDKDQKCNIQKLKSTGGHLLYNSSERTKLIQL